MDLPVTNDYLNLALATNSLVEAETLSFKSMGDLILPTGKLVACDPMADWEYPPFNLEILPGNYNVTLTIAHLPSKYGIDLRVAFACLHINQNPPLHWEMLTVGDQDLTTLKKGHIFGYGVDSGTGCLMDEKVAGELGALFESEEDIYEQFVDEIHDSYVPSWGWVNKQFESGNMIAFSTGWGDGTYASYVGYDTTNKPCVIVTDFAVVVQN